MIKFLSEFGPLIAFFVGYKYGDIQNATFYMLIAALVGIGIYYALERKIQTFSLVSSGILLVSAVITLLTGDSTFIKMKPTILYLVFGVSFSLSAKRGKPLLKYMLSEAFPLKNEKAWLVLSYRFSVFFFLMAIVNEMVWRNFEELFWVKFKVFGAVPLTLVFIALQAPFVLKNKARE